MLQAVRTSRMQCASYQQENMKHMLQAVRTQSSDQGPQCLQQETGYLCGRNTQLYGTGHRQYNAAPDMSCYADKKPTAIDS